MPDLRENIHSALAAFAHVEGAARPFPQKNQGQAGPATVEGASRPFSKNKQGQDGPATAQEQAAPATFKEAGLRFLRTLGYQSERALDLGDSSPETFRGFLRENASDAQFDESKALFADWKSADLLFQLTDEELSGNMSLFPETDIQPGLLRSYLFFAIELTGDHYPRGHLTRIARQINRVFPMPVMVLIKHQADKKPVLSIAVINRRQNKRDAAKDVLGKVTIIRDISLADPHRGHLDILNSFAFANLNNVAGAARPSFPAHQGRAAPATGINNFDALHAAWEEIFNVELLNKRFYRELSNWYFWALPQVEFPADLEPDGEKRRATGLIRLLTRLIFCWFLKEKGLVPDQLFVEAELRKILKSLDPDACSYHEAILQNLFFATLNQRMGKDAKGKPFRTFAKDEGYPKNRSTYGVDTLYRYEEHFRDPDTALDHFADIPFLNGGLFECLDRTDEESGKKRYLDGFSRNKKKRPNIPNRLFFGSEDQVDLSAAYGDKKRKKEKVRGLLHILNAYKFTIIENTPIDQEIALDPELLGKVFENLLASYNEETKTTARKQTGSFYTPRPIVEYMVDESLKAYLKTKVEGAARPFPKKDQGQAGPATVAGAARPSSRKNQGQAGPATIQEQAAPATLNDRLDNLFSYTEEPHAFSDAEADTLLEAIHSCKILDPACGSGAFPMGMLHKLVYIIHKLDPDNARWKQLQIDAASNIPDSGSREAAIAAIERDFADNEDDYGRKLYLIENCLYGVDIQPIAIQISKLRFFISLVCDQRTNRNKKDNHGIRALPNLETKFVAADTLIGLPIPEPDLFLKSLVEPIERKIEEAYHSHFAIQRRDQKLALQRKIKDLRRELADTLANGLGAKDNAEVTKKARHIAAWDPFDPQAVADFFDPHWMFGRSLAEGFDVVIGNPPYVRPHKLSAELKEKLWNHFTVFEKKADLYVCFIEKGISLLKPHGEFAYIVSNGCLRLDSFELLRKLLIEKTTIRTIVDFDEDVFESATVKTCILLLKKTPTNQHSVKVAIASAAREVESLNIRSIPQDKFSTNYKSIFDLSSESSFDAIKCKMSNGTVPFGSVLDISFGLKTGDDDKFLSMQPSTKQHRKLLRGQDIGRYTVKFKGEYVWYVPDRMREHRQTARPGTKERFEQPKILIRDTGGGLMGTYDGDSYFVKDVLVVTHSSSSEDILKRITGLLNSTLMRFFYNTSFPTLHVQRNELASLPIKQDFLQGTSCEKIAKAVEHIIAAKQVDPAADTTALERDIDQQVYALYGLTPEEIAIVEGTAP